MPMKNTDAALQERKTGAPTVPIATGKQEPMFFRVSAGLKRIIGRDLITNEFVAIFELIKNSFDAGALQVDLVFLDDQLFIIDDGKGMSRHDIVEKWLFVAYSAKREGTEDPIENGPESPDYRNRIRTPKVYAGNKGVGRFSCDRLGSLLLLQSRTINSNHVEVVEVDWDLFERDSKEEFIQIPVQHSEAPSFALPSGIAQPKQGTLLEIKNLRQPWDRDKLLKLKTDLAKLINPFGATEDKFEIRISVPVEAEEDQRILSQIKRTKQEEGSGYRLIVNGPIQNFIFDTLREKTTSIDVRLVEEGSILESKLVDRGELIYHIREPNPYELLKKSEFECQLYFLNHSAKLTFARRMGVPAVQFGSVFLFRNQFRVYPVGEVGVDSLGIDLRKQQRLFKRLGTRELIGRINVTGSGEDFKEATNRQGLDQTPAYEQLVTCFWDKCLKPLERYVVDITWYNKADKDRDDISLLLGAPTSARVTNLVSRLTNADTIELLDYSHNLVRILDEKAEDFEASLTGLKIVAEKIGDKKLSNEIRRAEARYRELLKAEEKARAEAARERGARAKAVEKAKEAEAAQQKAETAYKEEKNGISS